MSPEHLSIQCFLGVISLSSPWHLHRFEQKHCLPHRKTHFTCPTDKMLCKHCSAWYRYKPMTHFWSAGYRTTPLFGSSVWGKATLWFRVFLTCDAPYMLVCHHQHIKNEQRRWGYLFGHTREVWWNTLVEWAHWQFMLARAFLFSLTIIIKCCINITALSKKTKTSWSQSECLSHIWRYILSRCSSVITFIIKRKTDEDEAEKIKPLATPVKHQGTQTVTTAYAYNYTWLAPGSTVFLLCWQSRQHQRYTGQEGAFCRGCLHKNRKWSVNTNETAKVLTSILVFNLTEIISVKNIQINAVLPVQTLQALHETQQSENKASFEVGR